jgi:hypothetical protein
MKASNVLFCDKETKMHNEVNFHEYLNDSYDQISHEEQRFYDLFRFELIERSELIRRGFASYDHAAQRKILKKALLQMLNFSVSKKAGQYLVNLSLHHQELSVNREMFDLFMDCFDAALVRFNPKLTALHQLAWRVTLAPGIELMKHSELLVEQFGTLEEQQKAV